MRKVTVLIGAFLLIALHAAAAEREAARVFPSRSVDQSRPKLHLRTLTCGDGTGDCTLNLVDDFGDGSGGTLCAPSRPIQIDKVCKYQYSGSYFEYCGADAGSCDGYTDSSGVYHCQTCR